LAKMFIISINKTDNTRYNKTPIVIAAVTYTMLPKLFVVFVRGIIPKIIKSVTTGNKKSLLTD